MAAKYDLAIEVKYDYGLLLTTLVFNRVLKERKSNE